MLFLVVSRCAHTQSTPERGVSGRGRYLDAGAAMIAAGTTRLPWCARARHARQHRHYPARLHYGCARRVHAHRPSVPHGNLWCTHLYPGPWRHRRLAQGLHRPWLDGGQHPHHDLVTTPDPPEDRRLLRGEGATSALPLAPSPPATPPFFSHRLGLPLGTGNHGDRIPCHLIGSRK